MLDMIKKQGLNAVFFQIRNACDAVYESFDDMQLKEPLLRGIFGFG